MCIPMGKSANLPQTRLTFVLMNKSQTQGSRVSIKILLSLQCVVIWHVSVLQIFSIIIFIIWHTNQRVTHLLRHLLLLLLLLESLRIIMRWHLIGHDDQWKESIFFFQDINNKLGPLLLNNKLCLSHFIIYPRGESFIKW